ncbi:hypothetical protein ACFWPU_07305 [Streptomyces sp. NPDC058471]|uniref:hypothetical protein n=1 Tax=Streptomyces sp. NPDC058471 TaxID=3346516 RepID=UPI0036617090
MVEHHAEVPSSDSNHEPRPAQEITVVQAFIQHSTAFTTWFDAQEGSLPADTPLKVTFDESGHALFEVIRVAETETEAEYTPQAREFRYEVCQRSFSTAAALGSRRRVHLDRAASVPATRTNSGFTPEAPQKANEHSPEEKG